MANPTTTLRKTARGTGPVINRTSAIPADDLSDFLNEESSTELPTSAHRVESENNTPRQETPTVAEPVVQRLLAGPHKPHFLLMADWFESAIGDRVADACVETEVGDVFFKVVDWIESTGFLKIIVDGRSMPYAPKPMVNLCLRRRGERFRTTCISPGSPMFGDLPFVEILLIVESKEIITSNSMEKNARVENGSTPSVVSGRPSTRTVYGEPVADEDEADAVRRDVGGRNFDVFRDDEEG